MKINKKLIEKLFLFLVFSLLLYIGPSQILDRSISHNNPYGYFASDGFHHLGISDAVEYGGLKFLPAYISNGREDIIRYNPPLMYNMVPIFAQFTGLQMYDAIYLLTILFFVFTGLIIYLMIRELSISVAILSLPLFFVSFYKTFMTPITWGQWIFICGAIFMIATIYSIGKLKLKKSYILLAIFISASALAHTSEFVFAVGFIGFYLFISLIFGKLSIEKIKKIFIAACISLVLIGNYLIIFKNSWGSSFSFKIIQEAPFVAGIPVAFISDFKWVSIILLIGGLVSLLYIKKMNIALLSGIYLFLFTQFAHLIGMQQRGFQNRSLWPIYLSVFFGIAIYQFFKILPIKLKKIIYYPISIILIIILIFSFPNTVQGEGVMDRYHWESIQWLRENAIDPARVYYFYTSHIGINPPVWNTRRITQAVKLQDYIDALNNRSVKRFYKSDVLSAGGTYATRPSFFVFEPHFDEVEYHGPMDICNMDYYVFDIEPQYSRYPALVQYNLFIRSKLLENEWIKEVHNNQIVSILQNKKIGSDCIVEQKIN